MEKVINNWSGLSCRLFNLLISGDMFDIQLQVGKQVFGAHKLILCASSDVFKAMLTNRKWSESHKETIVLVEEPPCESVFGRFIHYIYTGQLYLSHSTVGPILILADKYNVKELIPLCHRYMLENLDVPMDKSCVIQWWDMANLHNDCELESKILNYIELNFTKVRQTSDFLCASVSSVEKLISSSKIVVPNEFEILLSVQSWLQHYVNLHEPSPHLLRVLCEKLTQHIRWHMFRQEDFDKFNSNLSVQHFLRTYAMYFHVPGSEVAPRNHQVFSFIMNEKQKVINNTLESREKKPLLSEVHSFKDKCNASAHTSEANSSNESLLYVPRVYTNDYWNTTLSVTNFAAFPQYGTQTFFFSTPKSGLWDDDGQSLDWEVEMHPKGVHFGPAIMINVESDGIKLVEEKFLDTVRLALISRSPHVFPFKVEINILLRVNSSSGDLFIERCLRHTCIFDSNHQRFNIDDIVPIDNLEMFLKPESLDSQLHLTPTTEFTLDVIIRPLSFSSSFYHFS